MPTRARSEWDRMSVRDKLRYLDRLDADRKKGVGLQQQFSDEVGRDQAGRMEMIKAMVGAKDARYEPQSVQDAMFFNDPAQLTPQPPAAPAPKTEVIYVEARGIKTPAYILTTFPDGRNDVSPFKFKPVMDDMGNIQEHIQTQASPPAPPSRAELDQSIGVRPQSVGFEDDEVDQLRQMYGR